MTGLTADDFPVLESTRRGRTRRGCTTTTSAARTTSPPTAGRRPRARAWAAGRIGLRENRRFLGRVVRYLAAEAGVTAVPRHRLGAADHGERPRDRAGGRPVMPGRLRRQRPDGARARPGAALLRAPGAHRLHPGRPEVAAGHPGRPVTASVLDFGQPIALMLVAVLHFLRDEDKPEDVISTLLDALPPGSYLAASHMTAEHEPADRRGQRAYREAGISMQMRTPTSSRRSRSPGSSSCRPGWCSSGNGGRTQRAAADPGRGVLLRRGRPQAVTGRDAGRRVHRIRAVLAAVIYAVQQY